MPLNADVHALLIGCVGGAVCCELCVCRDRKQLPIIGTCFSRGADDSSSSWVSLYPSHLDRCG